LAEHPVVALFVQLFSLAFRVPEKADECRGREFSQLFFSWHRLSSFSTARKKRASMEIPSRAASIFTCLCISAGMRKVSCFTKATIHQAVKTVNKKTCVFEIISVS